MNHIVREGYATDFDLFRRRLDQSAVGQEEIQRHVVRRTIRISNQLCNYAVIFFIDDSLARRQVLELEAFGQRIVESSRWLSDQPDRAPCCCSLPTDTGTRLRR